METSWRRNYLRYKSFFLNVLSQYKEKSELKAYLEILLSLTTVSIFAVFALRPTILTIAELIGQIEEKKTTISQMDAKIQSLSQAQNIYDRQSSSIDLLINYTIPKLSNSDIFARQIEALAVKNQVAISDFRIGKGLIYKKIPLNPFSIVPTDTENQDSDQKLDFHISVEAPIESYSSLATFLQDLEKLRTPPEIRNINFSQKSESGTTQKQLSLVVDGGLPYLE